MHDPITQHSANNTDGAARCRPPVWLEFKDGWRKVERAVMVGQTRLAYQRCAMPYRLRAAEKKEPKWTMDGGSLAYHVHNAPWNVKSSRGVVYVPRLASQSKVASPDQPELVGVSDSVTFVPREGYAEPAARRPDKVVLDVAFNEPIYADDMPPKPETAWKRTSQESRDETPRRAYRVPKDGGFTGRERAPITNESTALFNTHLAVLADAGVAASARQRKAIWRDCWLAATGQLRNASKRTKPARALAALDQMVSDLAVAVRENRTARAKSLRRKIDALKTQPAAKVAMRVSNDMWLSLAVIGRRAVPVPQMPTTKPAASPPSRKSVRSLSKVVQTVAEVAGKSVSRERAKMQNAMAAGEVMAARAKRKAARPVAPKKYNPMLDAAPFVVASPRGIDLTPLGRKTA